MHSTTIRRVITLTTEAAGLRASGKESEALALEAEVQQIASRSSRAKVPPDPWSKHEHFAKFESRRSLWDQARRGVHGDTAAINGTVKLAGKIEAKLAEMTAAGESTTAIAYAAAAMAKADEAEHYRAVRNQIAELANEDAVRELVAEARGDLEQAKVIAKARNVKFAPIFAASDDEKAEVEAEEEVGS